MKKKSIILLVFSILLGSPLLIQKTYASYTQEFIEYHGTSSIMNARSPLRQEIPSIDPDVDRYTKITSNNNQPRNVSSGTNPHNATDFSAPAYDRVYPLFKAKVVDFNPDTSGQLGSVLLQFDIDDDGIWDNYYANYLHVIPISGIYKNQEFDVDEYVAIIDTEKFWGPHLDLKDTNSSNNRSIKLFRFFRWITNWNLGAYLDYFSGDAIVGNNLYITAVSSRIATYDALQHVELYYKINSTGTWTKSSSTYTEWHAPTHRYEIDLKAGTGAVVGDTVYYYLAGVRSDITGYNHGLFPQYFKHPARDLTGSPVYANTIARQHTIQ